MTSKEVTELIEETAEWYDNYLEVRKGMISTEAIAILDEQAEVVTKQLRVFFSEFSKLLEKLK